MTHIVAEKLKNNRFTIQIERRYIVVKKPMEPSEDKVDLLTTINGNTALNTNIAISDTSKYKYIVAIFILSTPRVSLAFPRSVYDTFNGVMPDNTIGTGRYYASIVKVNNTTIKVTSYQSASDSGYWNLYGVY